MAPHITRTEQNRPLHTINEVFFVPCWFAMPWSTLPYGYKRGVLRCSCILICTVIASRVLCRLPDRVKGLSSVVCVCHSYLDGSPRSRGHCNRGRHCTAAGPLTLLGAIGRLDLESSRDPFAVHAVLLSPSPTWSGASKVQSQARRRLLTPLPWHGGTPYNGPEAVPRGTGYPLND